MKNIRVTIKTASQSLVSWVEPGQTVWDAIQFSGLWPPGDCGGRGTCGKCKVKVEGLVDGLSSEEINSLLPEEIKKGYRLSCQCRIMGEAVVSLPEVRLADLKPGLLMFEHFPGILPAVRTVNGCIPRFDRYMPVPLMDRIQRAFKNYAIDLSPENVNALARLDKGDGVNVTAGIIDGVITRIYARGTATLLGLALDIGTTSLMMAAVDLINGELKGVFSCPNSQIQAGRDVLSRISYAGEEPGNLLRLQEMVLGDIRALIKQALDVLQAGDDDLMEMVVVGNPVMLHLLLGLDPSSLGRSPYIGLFRQLTEISVPQLGLPMNPAGRVVILPQIGGFLGADVVGCLLAADLEGPGCTLLIDIGTNGEIVLKNNDQYLACSVAAGPAFEGVGITSGMMAVNGAIDRFWIEKGRIRYSVLGGSKPRGICGSGLLDLLAVLLELRVLDETGLIDGSRFPGRCRDSSNGTELVIVEGEDTAEGVPVVINQQDIRQLQLAKGAVRTGVEMLMKEAGLSAADIDEVLLAGSFGNHLHPRSLLRCGMLPGLRTGVIRNIGNAAARGALTALLSLPEREKSKVLAGRVRPLNLADRPDFSEMFLQSMNLISSITAQDDKSPDE